MGSIDTHRGLRIAVLHGGIGAFRSESLASGRSIALSLVQSGHLATLIDAAEAPLDSIEWPAYDVCCVAMPADLDAAWQKRLEMLDIPHTGSGTEACQLAASRSSARQSFLRFFVPTPAFVVLRRCVSPAEAAARVASLGYPLLVRPDHPQAGSNAKFVRNAEELSAALATSFADDDRVLCERFLRGREFAITLLGERPLPPVELPLPGEAGAQPPAHTESQLTEHEKNLLEHTALLAAGAIGAAGLVQVDLVLDHNNRPWVLEVNTAPSLSETSPAARAAAKVGLSLNDLCQWMVQDCLVVESLR
ncbi:MAG TPA: hypothetical protein VL096_06610 [Pirellulaceae bacterium]|nr:hypothetical protein [Pirellulaceae bacterium]